ncbi:hypothetical protein [Runella zeae]|uniref:hypothetical protein n=1 Tax=Runella zeae TaxID=94255 RepID=UPI002356E0D8|nr:hypothetical protein [Runella zeae]
MYSLARLKKLLWFDAIAATVAATGIFFLKDLMQPYLGLPSALLSGMGFTALVFALYGFHLLMRKITSKRWIQILIYGNATYAIFCLVLSLYFLFKIPWIGIVYLWIDTAIVETLSYIEWKTTKHFF